MEGRIVTPVRFRPVGAHSYAVYSPAGEVLGVVHRDESTIGAWQTDGPSATHYPSREAAAWALIAECGADLAELVEAS
jgi:hypothetical protein